MGNYQEVMDFNNLSQLWTYVQTHSFSAICIGIILFLSPFLVKALIQVVWRSFMLLGQFFFKDQIRSFLRSKIARLLQLYVDENLDIGDMPLYQSNMITLYSLFWHGTRVHAHINRAEIRVDLGATIRQYLKLWLKSFFSRFDYRLAQKELLCNCIKDVRLYRAEMQIASTDDGFVTEEKLLQAGKQQLDKTIYNLEDLRKLKLNLSFENGEILIRLGQEEFRLQNFFGTIENIPGPEGSNCSLRFGCIYDGENISFNSLDNNLEHFLLVVSDLYISNKIWHVLAHYYPDLPRDIGLRDGKLLDLRLRLGLKGNQLLCEGLSLKLDEVSFNYGEHVIQDLELSLATKDMQVFELNKLRMDYDEWSVVGRCCFSMKGELLCSELVEFRVGVCPVCIRDAWYNLQTGKYGGKLQPKIVRDTKEMVESWGANLQKTLRGSVDKVTNKLKSLVE